MLSRALGADTHTHVELGEELPPVEADPTQLEQVLVNLVLNAQDAMPDGGHLEIRTLEVPGPPEERSEAQGLVDDDARPWVALVVRDSGRGMTPEVRTRAFEPFFTTKEEEGRSGLGLSTVYAIVAQSRGEIEVESEDGRGSTVTVYLPAADPV